MSTESYINKIMDETGLSRKDIQDLVDEKKAELKGLITDDGALLLIAKELKVEVKKENKDTINNFEVKISDVSLGMKNIVLVGRIKEVNKIFNFTRSDGSEGYVGSFLIQDESGEIRIVLWDDDTNILRDENFVSNEVVKIINGYTKEGRFQDLEIHVGRFGKIILCPEDIEYNKIPKIKQTFTKVGDITPNFKSYSIKGQVVSLTPAKEFVRSDGNTGKVGTLNIMDSTGIIRIIFWNEDVDKIQGIKEGDCISITQLSPRESKLNSKTIELSASSNTIIKKIKGNFQYEAKLAKHIKELQEIDNLISFKGVLTSIRDIRKVALKSGEDVSVIDFEVSDNTGSIRVTAWRDLAENLAEKLTNGMTVLVSNVKLKYNEKFDRKEAIFNNFSEIEKINEKIEFNQKISSTSTNSKLKFTETKIESINSMGFFEIKGSIIKEIDLSKKDLFIYDACPICFKKDTNCKCKKKEDPEKRMILKVILDDESGTIKTSFFGQQAEELIGKKASEIAKMEDIDNILKDLEGRSLIVRGKASLNDFNDMNNYELSVVDFQFTDPKEELNYLMEELNS